MLSFFEVTNCDLKNFRDLSSRRRRDLSDLA